MGSVTFSLDDRLVEHLRTVLPLNVLVETGTFRGNTVADMAASFAEIHSVELSQDLFEQVSQRFAQQEHIHVRQGESPEFLHGLQPRIAGRSVLFWLDAHWCVQDAAEGETSQCPLLDELAAIGRLDDRSIVLIDDARLYLCPAPCAHETSQWPSLEQVLSALRALNDRHEIMVVNDVIVFFPPPARTSLEGYAREHGVDWLAVMGDQRDCDDLQRQLKQVRDYVVETKQTAATYETIIDQQQQRLENYRQVSAADKNTNDQLRHTIDQLKQTNEQQTETTETLRANLEAAQQRCDAQRELTRQRDEALARKHADLERVRTDLGQRLANLREQLQSRSNPKGRGITAHRTEAATT